MSTTADTYYTCPKCGEANSKLMPRQGVPDVVNMRICLICWARWIPGERYPSPHWTDARGVLKDVAPGVPSEELVREMRDEVGEAYKQLVADLEAQVDRLKRGYLEYEAMYGAYRPSGVSDDDIRYGYHGLRPGDLDLT